MMSTPACLFSILQRAGADGRGRLIPEPSAKNTNLPIQKPANGSQLGNSHLRQPKLDLIDGPVQRKDKIPPALNDQHPAIFYRRFFRTPSVARNL